MAKQPKLNYDQVETLYLYGYNTKEIAGLLGSVNGHISKVLRHMGVAMRKRGEIVDKVAFVNMDSDAQTLLKPIRVNLEAMYDDWVSRPRKTSRIVAAPTPTKTKQKKKEKAKKAKAESKKESTTVNVVINVVEQTKDEPKKAEVQEEDILEVLQSDEVVDAPTSSEELLEEMDSMLAETETVDAVPDVLEDVAELTEDGTAIVRGEAFKQASLEVQGKIIAHFMAKGMAQRPIAKELDVAQSSISKTWSKYKKEVKA